MSENDRYQKMMEAIRRWATAQENLRHVQAQLENAAAGFYDGCSNAEKISQLWDAKAELAEVEMALMEFTRPTIDNPPTDAPEVAAPIGLGRVDAART